MKKCCEKAIMWLPEWWALEHLYNCGWREKK